MPQDAADLWDFIVGLDHASVMALFAHCASLTVNALKLPWEHNKRRAYVTADRLATALALDMSQHWTPTVSSYLGRVTKAHILAAVREGSGDAAAERLSAKKKKEMAEAAERELAGTEWLPPLLRTEPPAWADDPQAEADAGAEEPGDPEAMPTEASDPHAEAAEPDVPEADETAPDTPDPDADADPEPAPDTPDPDADADPETAPVSPDPDAEDGSEDTDREAFSVAAE